MAPARSARSPSATATSHRATWAAGASRRRMSRTGAGGAGRWG